MISMKRFILFVACTSMVLAQSVAQEKYSHIYENLSVYSDVFRQLELNYVDSIHYQQLTETAINAMLNQLDPYTNYIPKSETDDIEFMTTGEYGGIGALTLVRNGRLQIAGVYEGKPAQRNGIMAGDYILSIDGETVNEENVRESTDMLKGEPHEKITLMIERGGEDKPITKVFEREIIQINPVPYYACIAPGVAFVKLNDFTDKAALEVKSALAEMSAKEPLTSLIIDLRNNGGGLLHEAVKILSYFVPKGTEVVRTKGKNGEVMFVYKTTTAPLYPNLKIAVLTNNQSASASEILAGTLQDLDAAVLIGKRTFGKGLVQSIRSLCNGAYLKVTNAKYYIPSGRCIQAIDYQHRGKNGEPVHVPDSLTAEFKTKHGRIVRDGGGISPDVIMNEKDIAAITYYLLIQYKFLDYATQYKQQTPTVAPASEFEISDADLAEFEKYLMEQKFTYISETERLFDEMHKVADYEGIDSIAEAEFAALKEKLKPNIPMLIEMNKEEIKQQLGEEIMKLYYYQRGEIEFINRYDNLLEHAKEIVSDDKVYRSLLKPKK